MRIEVTAKDIQHGIAGNCHECPVARAIKRATGRACAVTPHRFHFWDEWRGTSAWQEVEGDRDSKECRYIPLPPEVCVFITSFDLGDKPEPFSFEIDDKLIRRRKS